MTDPVIGSDGTVFSAFVSYNYTTTACGGVANYTQNLSLMELNASGAVSYVPYDSISMPVNTRQVLNADVIPDGQGGALISWGIPVAPYSNELESHITDVSSSGTIDAIFPPSYGLTQMVLGDNNTGFISYGTSIASFAVPSLQPRWTYYQPSGGLSLVVSSQGGGVVAKDTSNGTDTVVRLDASGNATTDSWTASNVINFGGDFWYGTLSSGGSLDELSAGSVEASASPWLSTDGVGAKQAAQVPTIADPGVQTGPNETAITGVVQEIFDALPISTFSGSAPCYTWLNNGQNNVAALESFLAPNRNGSGWFHSSMVNADSTLNYETGAITGESLGEGDTTVNDNGMFFLYQYPAGNNQFKPLADGPNGEYTGNTPNAQSQTVLHELGHQALFNIPNPVPRGAWQQNDGGHLEEVKTNEIIVDRNCGKMIRALPGINPIANVPPGVKPGLSPTSGTSGTVTINGAHFGSSQGQSSVTFAGANGPIPAAVANWRNGRIIVTIPNGAATGNIIVNVSISTGQGNFSTISITGPVFTVQ